MKTPIQKILFSSLLSLMVVGSAFAEDKVAATNGNFIKDLQQETDDLELIKKRHSDGFKTLFLSVKQRQRIDEQRLSYLNPKSLADEKDEKILPKTDDKPKKKRIYIPPKVAISAVIIKPDGSTLVRINNKYNQSPSKYIDVNAQAANSSGVPITVNGKTQMVPVGQTLLTRQGKLVDTYKLDAQARQKQLPKTEQKAVKERLDQVKILNANPEPLEPVVLDKPVN